MFFYKIQYGLHHEKTCFCTSENKGAGQLCDCFTTYIVHSLYFINSKVEASSHTLCLYSLVFVTWSETEGFLVMLLI